jgi:hypothetical protein
MAEAQLMMRLHVFVHQQDRGAQFAFCEEEIVRHDSKTHMGDVYGTVRVQRLSPICSITHLALSVFLCPWAIRKPVLTYVLARHLLRMSKAVGCTRRASTRLDGHARI